LISFKNIYVYKVTYEFKEIFVSIDIDSFIIYDSSK